MKKDVMISLVSIQQMPDDSSKTELTTKAEYSYENGCDTIVYKDTSVTGFEGSVTTIKVCGEKNAAVMRVGTINSALTMEIGRKHFCQYSTPFGSLQIGVYTHAIENDMSTGGRIYLKYTLDLNSSFLSENEIIITLV